MRRWLLVLVGSTLLGALPLTCHFSQEIAGLVVPPPDPEQVQALRDIATKAVARYEKLYGHLPAEEWPEQPRRTYEAARRCLADLDHSRP